MRGAVHIPHLVSVMALALLPAAAPAEGEAEWLAEASPRAAQIIVEAAAECAAEDKGELIFEDAALVPADLDGDNGLGPDGGPDDMVVDFNHIFCSRAYSLWAGSGGATVHFVLDGTTSQSWRGANWEVERIGAFLPAVILLPRHGSVCDSYGAAPCVTAIVAQDGVFYTPVSPN